MTAGSATSRSSSSYRRSISARRSSMAARHARSERARSRGASAGRRGARVARSALLAVLAVEALDPAGGVHELLLAGEEGMARRADLDVDALLRGAGFDDIAACADDGALLVAGMNAFLHGARVGLLTGAAGGRNPGPGPPATSGPRRADSRWMASLTA